MNEAEALRAEMAGYLQRGQTERANQVAAVLRQRGKVVETADAAPGDGALSEQHYIAKQVV